MKSRAAVAFGPGKPLEIVEIDEKNNLVSVRVEATDENGNTVVEGTVHVNPPQLLNQLATPAVDTLPTVRAGGCTLEVGGGECRVRC